MAIMEMSRLKLIGLNKHKNSVMETLASSGVFEVSKSEDTAGENVNATLDRLLVRQAKIKGAIDYIEKTVALACSVDEAKKTAAKKTKTEVDFLYGVKPVKNGLSGRKVITYDDWYDASAKEYELMAVCDALDKNSFRRADNKAEIDKLAAKKQQIRQFENCPIDLGVNYDTRNTFTLTLNIPRTEVLGELGKYDLFSEVYPESEGYTAIVVGRAADKAEVLKTATGLGASVCQLNYKGNAKQIIKECDERARQLDAKETELIKECLTYAKYLGELKILYDFFGREAEKAVAENGFKKTRNTFIIEGYIPETSVEKLTQKIKSENAGVIAQITPAGDDAPTLIKSSALVAPYESITNMYAAPAYREGLDPNPFMAVFFFVFFGIMIGDAGYGIILSIVCGLMIKLLKPEKGMKNLLAIIAMGGISAIVWGVVFGGFFAISGIPALWFAPMDEPVLMLAVSIILGVIQLLFGYALNSVKSFKKGKPLDAILDSVFIYTLVGGIACIALNMLFKSDGNVLTDVVIYLIIGSLVGIVLTAGRHKKGILNKLMGGFAGLYNLVNLMSDVLSYARIFGLGLASGAIGYAFNVLGGMLFDIPIVGYPLGIIILVFLHAFNIGIGILGAYVHNARLQFLEFYGKFYEGGGRLFAPMGENTKYVRFN